MKQLMTLSICTLAFLASSTCAFAFSEEQSPNVRSDSSSNFSDPDERRPGFVIGQRSGTDTNRDFATAPAVTIPTIQDTDNGARAFDHAFAHQAQ